MQPAYIAESIRKTKQLIESTSDSTPFLLYHCLSPLSDQIDNGLQDIHAQIEEAGPKLCPLPSIEQGRGLLAQFDDLLNQVHALSAALSALEEINSCQVLNTAIDYCYMDKYICVDTNDLHSKLLTLTGRLNTLLNLCRLQKNYLVSCETPALSQDLHSSSELLAGKYLILFNGDPVKARSSLITMAEDVYHMLGTKSLTGPDLQNMIEPFLKAAQILRPISIADLYDHLQFQSKQGEREEAAQHIPEQSKNEQQPNDLETSLANHSPPETMKLENMVPNLPDGEDTSPSNQEESVSKEQPTDVEKEKKTTISHQEYNIYKQNYDTLRAQYDKVMKSLADMQSELKDMSSVSKEQMLKFTQTRSAEQEIKAKLIAAAEKLKELNEAIKAGTLTWEKKPHAHNQDLTQRKKSPPNIV